MFDFRWCEILNNILRIDMFHNNNYYIVNRNKIKNILFIVLDLLSFHIRNNQPKLSDFDLIALASIRTNNNLLISIILTLVFLGMMFATFCSRTFLISLVTIIDIQLLCVWCSNRLMIGHAESVVQIHIYWQPKGQYAHC